MKDFGFFSKVGTVKAPFEPVVKVGFELKLKALLGTLQK
jgi:hypothetical protein